MEAAVVYVLILCLLESFLNTHVCTALELDRELPNGVMGRLLASPELMFEPRVDENNLISFTMRKPDTYTPYYDRLTTFLEDYYAPDWVTEKHVDCHTEQGMRNSSEWDKICRFDLASYELDNCVKQWYYGFDDGMPCVFLYLDRTYNWLPETYDNATKPEAIENNWNPYELTVTCEGIDPVSKDNIVSVDFPDLKGFPLKYFPDIGLPGYQIPIVPVRITPVAAVAVEVTCKLWAKNAKQSDLLNTGMVRFTVIVH